MPTTRSIDLSGAIKHVVEHVARDIRARENVGCHVEAVTSRCHNLLWIVAMCCTMPLAIYRTIGLPIVVVSKWKRGYQIVNIELSWIVLKTRPKYSVEHFAANLWLAVKDHATVDAANVNTFPHYPGLGTSTKAIHVVESCTANIPVYSLVKLGMVMSVEHPTAPRLVAKVATIIYVLWVALLHAPPASCLVPGNVSITSAAYPVVRLAYASLAILVAPRLFHVVIHVPLYVASHVGNNNAVNALAQET